MRKFVAILVLSILTTGAVAADIDNKTVTEAIAHCEKLQSNDRALTFHLDCACLAPKYVEMHAADYDQRSFSHVFDERDYQKFKPILLRCTNEEDLRKYIAQSCTSKKRIKDCGCASEMMWKKYQELPSIPTIVHSWLDVEKACRR